MKASKAAIIALAPLTLAACASAPAADRVALAGRVERDLGVRPAGAQDAPSLAAARERLALLLDAPLNAQSTVQIALLGNPRVTAAFETLGVGHAAFIDAVRPAPPSLHFLELTPQAAGPDFLTYGVGFDLLSLLTLPAKRRAATGLREANRAQATAEILQVAYEARAAWIDLAATRQTADLMAQAAHAAAASAAAAEALYSAGNIARVERDREALYAAEIAVADAQAQAALTPARERLVAALGLASDQAMRLGDVERLPPPPDTPIAVAEFEARVVAANTDLAVATGILAAARAHHKTSWLTSLAPGLMVEAELERDNGDRKQGLGFALIAPLYDLGGANRLRSASAARRAEALAQALEVELRAEARGLLFEAEAARRAALMRRDVILPLSADVFDGAVQDFNAMQIGILQLLQERRARLYAGLATITGVAEYWRAQARLDLLLAGARTSPQATAQQAEPASRVSDPGH